jgi:hypothetical protein
MLNGTINLFVHYCQTKFPEQYPCKNKASRARKEAKKKDNKTKKIK